MPPPLLDRLLSLLLPLRLLPELPRLRSPELPVPRSELTSRPSELRSVIIARSLLVPRSRDDSLFRMRSPLLMRSSLRMLSREPSAGSIFEARFGMSCLSLRFWFMRTLLLVGLCFLGARRRAWSVDRSTSAGTG
jgi:hypothetical protein